jgi:hypothetical protein
MGNQPQHFLIASTSDRSSEAACQGLIEGDRGGLEKNSPDEKSLVASGVSPARHGPLCYRAPSRSPR